MTKSDAVPVPEYVHKAHAAKLKAEARAARAQARVSNLEAAAQELHLEATEIQMDDVRRVREYQSADDVRHHIYRFTGAVTTSTAEKCADTLTRWSRIEPGCDIEIVFFSPGGSVTDGMMLFDTIMQLRAEGHKIDTKAIGMAASMGSILLQVGETRRMTKESWLLLHNLSAGASGSLGEIEDQVEWFKKITRRTLDIFADRCKRSKGKKKLTRAEIEKNMNRTDWWIDSDQCLAFGLVDEIV